jgi:hypothetical protein
MRGILNDLLSDSYQSTLPAKGGIPLPHDMVPSNHPTLPPMRP